VIVDIHAYLRKERNLLKVAGNDPTIRANIPRTTATIAASTRRSFQLYFIKQSYDFYFSIFMDLKASRNA